MVDNAKIQKFKCDILSNFQKKSRGPNIFYEKIILQRLLSKLSN